MNSNEKDIVKKDSRLEFSAWIPLFAGATYGILMRILFEMSSFSDKDLEVMTFAFIIIVPIAVGVVTVVFAEAKKSHGFLYFIFAPWASITIFVLGTAISLLEGLICIAMAFPLFLVLGSFGGLVAGIVTRYTIHRKSIVTCVGVLPILVGFYEAGEPMSNIYAEISRDIYIEASPNTVWHQINYPTNIKPKELKNGFAYKIGVPYPIEARTLEERVGGMRNLIWQRGITFREEITAWEENRYIAWNYIFDKNSFPPGSMDDHVVIGGKYFDLRETSYTLIPTGKGTLLVLKVGYRVSTSFNWYSQFWGDFLIADTAETILEFYRNRSEASIRNLSK